MDPAPAIRAARRRAGLSQAALASRAGTSQATLSAYERGTKQPSVRTLSRLLAAAGARLTVVADRSAPVEPSDAQHARTARTLHEVLALADALPVRHERTLAFPALTRR